MDEPADGVSEDALLGGAVRLLQPRAGHRAGTDAVLLAAAASAIPARRIVDLGSASGAVGLQICRRRPAAELLFVDRDPVLVDLCRRNIRLNAAEGRAEAIVADVLTCPEALRPAGLVPDEADLVVTNPPFFEEDGIRRSPQPGRRRAHVMEAGGLDGWIGTATWLLRPKGTVCLIHRADQLARCLKVLSGGFGGIEVTPVHPRADKPASRILIVGRKGSRAPLGLLPPIVLHEADGGFTAQAEALHRA